MLYHHSFVWWFLTACLQGSSPTIHSLSYVIGFLKPQRKNIQPLLPSQFFMKLKLIQLYLRQSLTRNWGRPWQCWTTYAAALVCCCILWVNSLGILIYIWNGYLGSILPWRHHFILSVQSDYSLTTIVSFGANILGGALGFLVLFTFPRFIFCIDF